MIAYVVFVDYHNCNINIYLWSHSYTANALAVNSTFYFCVENSLTVSCDFSRYLSVVYKDQYSALFT